MKHFSALLLIGCISLASLASVSASQGNPSSSGSGMSQGTGTMYKQNRMQQLQERKDTMKKRLDELKQKRDNMKNRRTGSGMTQSGGTLTTEQLACVRAAVAKRETALQSLFAMSSAATSSGYLARASALDSAWALQDTTARRDAVNTAWKNWKDSQKVTHDADKNTRKTIIDTFKFDVKTCKVPEGLTDMNNAVGSDDSGMMQD